MADISRTSISVDPDFDQEALFRQFEAAVKKLPDVTITPKLLARDVNKQITKLNSSKLKALNLDVNITAASANKAIREVNSKKLVPLSVDVKFSRTQIQRALKEAGSGLSISSATSSGKSAVVAQEANEGKQIASLRKALQKQLVKFEFDTNQNILAIRKSQWSTAAKGEQESQRARTAAVLAGTRERMAAEKAESKAIAAQQRLNDTRFKRLSSNVSGLSNSLRGFEFASQKIFKTVGLTIGTFGVGATAAVAGFTAKSVQSFAELQKSARNAAIVFAELEPGYHKLTSASARFAVVNKTTTATLEAARQVSLKTTFSAKDLSDGLFFLASAGVRAGVAIKDLGGIAKFAQAGLFDVQTAAELLLQAANATGVGLGNLGKLEDELTLANDRSQTSLLQLSQALTNKAGASFKLFKQPVEQTIALLQEFGNAGVVGVNAGTQLSIVIRDVARAASGAKDTPLHQYSQAFKHLGLQVFDGQGKLKDFAATIDDLANKLGPLNAKQQVLALRSLGLTDKSSAGLRQLIVRSLQLQTQGSSLEKQAQSLAKNSSGAVTRAAQNQLRTVSAQFDLFKNNIVALSQVFGEPLARSLTGILSPLNKGGGLFKEFNKQATLLGGQLSGNVVKALKSITRSDVNKFIEDVVSSLKLAVTGFKGFFTAFSGQLKDADKNTSILVSIGSVVKGLGQAFAIIAPEVGKVLGEITGFIQKNPELVKQLAQAALVGLVFAKVLRIIVVPLLDFAALIEKIAASEGLATLIAQLSEAETGVSGLAGAFSEFAGLAGPIGAVGFVIVSLIKPIIDLDKTSKSFQETIHGLSDAFGIMAQIIGAVLAPPLALLNGLFRLLGDTVKLVQDPFVNFFRLLDQGDGIFKAFIKSIALGVLDLGKFFADFATTLVAAIFSPFEKLPVIGGKIKAAVQGIQGEVDGTFASARRHLVAQATLVAEAPAEGVKRGTDFTVGFIALQKGRVAQALASFASLNAQASKDKFTPGPQPGFVRQGDVQKIAAAAKQQKHINDLRKSANADAALQVNLQKQLAQATKDAGFDFSGGGGGSQKGLGDAASAAGDKISSALKRAGSAVNTLQSQLKPVSDELDKQKSLVDKLATSLDNLKSTNIAGTKGFEDQKFAIDQQSKALQLQQTNLQIGGATSDSAQVKALQDQIDKLNLQSQQIDLTESLQIDPLKKQLDEKINPTKELPFDQIVSQFDAITKKHAAEQTTLNGLQKQYDALNSALSKRQAILDRLQSQQETFSASATGKGTALAAATAIPDTIGKPLKKANDQLQVSNSALQKSLGSSRELIRQPFRLATQDISTYLANLPKTAAKSLALALSWADSTGEALGAELIGGFITGMRSFLAPKTPLYNLLHVEIPAFIRANKGPVEYDRTILVPAGVAVMEGLTTGLRRGFEPVKGFLKDVGPSLEEFVPDSVFGKKTAEFLVEVAAGKKPDPNKFFSEFTDGAGSLSVPLDLGGAINDPRLSFLHKTLSIADTASMARDLAKTFGLQITALGPPGLSSALGLPGHNTFVAGSGRVSDHTKGLAADLSNGVLTPQEDALAAALKPLYGTIFKQLIYRDHDLNQGFFVAGHDNHVHVAWLPAPGFSIGDGKIGKPSLLAGGKGFGTQTPFESIIEAASKTFHVAASLIKAVIKQESGFQPNVSSSAGAKGLMQLEPGTFAGLHVGNDIFDPRENIFAGTKYLKSLLNHFHSPALAIAGYNAGGNAVERFGGIPPFAETIEYVKKVLQYLKEFGGFRANGGRTAANTMYITGEKGPEPFIADRPGFVMSNEKMNRMLNAAESQKAGYGTYAPQYNIQGASADEIVKKIDARERRRLQRLG